VKQQNNGKKEKKFTYKNKLGLITNLNSKKLCEIDLFNSALKTCKRTKVNSVWKWIPARSYTLTEKNLHAHYECFDAYKAWIYAHVWPDKDWKKQLTFRRQRPSRDHRWSGWPL